MEPNDEFPSMPQYANPAHAQAYADGYAAGRRDALAEAARVAGEHVPHHTGCGLAIQRKIESLG